MSQLTLDFEPPLRGLVHPVERRIDRTIENLARVLDEMTDDERAAVQSDQGFNAILIVQRVRAMERGEEAVLAQFGELKPGQRWPLADAYDRIIEPGVGHAADALIRVFIEVFG